MLITSFEESPDDRRVTCDFGRKAGSKCASNSNGWSGAAKAAVLAHPRKVEYTQGIQSDKVVFEEIVYTASKDHPELKASIDQWFAQHHITATFSQPNEGDRKVREWKAPGISIRFSYEPGELFVWLTHDIDTNRPNQALQPTAGRRGNFHIMTSTLKLAAKLAPASGG
jgi:hypothetical protein